LHSKKPKQDNTTSNCNIGVQYECLDHTCIPFDQVCDFYPTCQFGEDEADCPAICDFDSPSYDPLCFWGTDDDDKNPLLVGVSNANYFSAINISANLPETDNTIQNETGHYMLIYSLNFNSTVDNEDLHIYSPQFVSSSPACTFSMDYYVAIDGKIMSEHLHR